MPNMLESINNYTYQGCYNNNDNTAIPTLLNKDLKDAETCSDIAFTKGYNTFGLTEGGCYVSNDLGKAKVKVKMMHHIIAEHQAQVELIRYTIEIQKYILFLQKQMS